MKNNIVGWFEIPVVNMERAITFYETVIGVKLDKNKIDSVDMAMFPWVDEEYGSGGALVYNQEFCNPSADGVMVYLTALSGDLANELAKVEKAGGKVLQEKTKISDEHGFMGVFLDTEGNRVALHSRPC